MFSVSGIDGRLFQGTLEELLKTEGVHPVRRERRPPPGGRDASSLNPLSPDEERRYHAAASTYAAAEKPQVNRGPVYRAFQIMSRDVFTVRPDAGVEHAWRALVERQVGQAPVVDRGHLVGLVTRAHLLHVLNEEGGKVRDVLSRTVADVMRTPVVTVDPMSDVRRIARVTLEFAVPALPVVDREGALEGIVSRGDILRVVVTDPPLTLWA